MTEAPAPVPYSDTIAAIATGAVLSAIGIVRVSGPDTLAVIDRVFVPLAGALTFAFLHDTEPKKAKRAGVGAIVGFVSRVLTIILGYALIFLFILLARRF